MSLGQPDMKREGTRLGAKAHKQADSCCPELMFSLRISNLLKESRLG